MRAFSMLHAVKCQGAASYHAFSQQRRLPVLSDLFVVWSGVHVSCTSHQLDRSRSPKMHCIHLLVSISTSVVHVHGGREVLLHCVYTYSSFLTYPHTHVGEIGVVGEIEQDTLVTLCK